MLLQSEWILRIEQALLRMYVSIFPSIYDFDCQLGYK
jgi:hypothetical protein